MEELKLLVDRKTIAKRVEELGKEITKDYQGKELVLIGILKGAFVFLADLVRAIELPELKVDFVRLRSYGSSDETSGTVEITKDVELPVKGKHLLVVEDIVDTGLTLKFLLERLKALEPASVRVCCFVDKKERRRVDVRIDYRAFEVPKGFLVGYGLDFAERYRHLPGLYEVTTRK